MSEKVINMIAVFNKGLREYTTSKGVLKPQTSIELPEAEAKDLLGYTDVIDASKLVKSSGNELSTLRKENADLKNRIQELESQLATKGSDTEIEGGKKKKAK